MYGIFKKFGRACFRKSYLGGTTFPGFLSVGHATLAVPQQGENMYAGYTMYDPYEDMDRIGMTDEDMDEHDAYNMAEDAAMEMHLFGDC